MKSTQFVTPYQTPVIIASLKRPTLHVSLDSSFRARLPVHLEPLLEKPFPVVVTLDLVIPGIREQRCRDTRIRDEPEATTNAFPMMMFLERMPGELSDTLLFCPYHRCVAVEPSQFRVQVACHIETD